MDSNKNSEKNTKILAAWKQFQERIRSIQKKEKEYQHQAQHQQDQRQLEELKNKLQ
jgi:glutamate synthase domain-containing protein 3